MLRQSEFKSFNQRLLTAYLALQAISLSETLALICFSAIETQMRGHGPPLTSVKVTSQRLHCGKLAGSLRGSNEHPSHSLALNRDLQKKSYS